MALNADTELRFDDVVLPANSAVLSMFSSVLRGAIESHMSAHSSSKKPPTTTSSSSSGTTKAIVVPMEGVTKAQWLHAAAFWHRVNPAPTVESWQEAEELLRIGSRFDLIPVLQKAGDFLAANLNQLTNTITSRYDLCIWKWLLLADEVCLSSCLPALINRAVEIDRAGCSNLDNLQGLSAATLSQLVVAVAEALPLSGTARYYCTSRQCRASGRQQFTLSWRCKRCTCLGTATSKAPV